jgi:pyruvate/oxaloacetate carboxyltransferase
VTGRPADALAPRMPALRDELATKKIPPTDENAVLFAMFPRETEAFYHPKAAPVSSAGAVAAAAATESVRPSPPNTAATSLNPAPFTGKISRYALTVGDHRYETSVEVID